MRLPRKASLSSRLRRGAIAVKVAICLVPLLGVTAIALDGGVLLDKRRDGAQIRWFVLPQRPAGTDALSEAALAKLVTPEAMMGVALIPAPPAA